MTNLSPLKLIIFDCDGVLFDSKAANQAYYDHLLAKFGYPPMDPEELDYVHTHHVYDSIRHIFRRYPMDIEAVDQYRKKIDYGRFIPSMIMAPDLKEFLSLIRPRYRTAISTNRTTTMPLVLKTFGLEPFFDLVVTALDVKHPKPHPEALIKILTHFGLQVKEAVFVGDSMVDKEHAEGLGMTFVAYDNPDLPAHFHVRSFMEIGALPVF